MSPSQRPLPENTQHSQQTNIHAPGGIRTHDLSRRAAVGLRLRPRGYWDRLYYPITWYNSTIIKMCVNVKERPLPHFLHFYITLALPNNGRHYRPKHVAVNVMNE